MNTGFLSSARAGAVEEGWFLCQEGFSDSAEDPLSRSALTYTRCHPDIHCPSGRRGECPRRCEAWQVHGAVSGGCYPGAACLHLSEPSRWVCPLRGRGIACRSALPFGLGDIGLGLENKASNMREIEMGEGGRKREGERRKEKEREHTPCGGLSWKLRVEDGGAMDL